ncbi:twin-arginine translocation signal domain-containing protein [Halobacterium sp. GSL-19]|nr:twin-arginine translocation signal domain-containing protein [Halobacterium sp. GSL-19]
MLLSPMTMTGDGMSNTSRRRFLKATGAAALTATVAGCSDSTSDADGSGGSEPTDTPTTTGESTDYQPDFDKYPYGIDETKVAEARKVMEEAGYGPDNKYELNWLQYQSPTWKEMANTIRARLEQAHIEMTINDANFSSLLETTKQGEHEAFTLGWVADYPRPRNFMQLVQPDNTVYGGETAANGARLYWKEDANSDPGVREFMTEQYERLVSNPGQSEDAIQTRKDAATNMEEGIWESAALIPVYHNLAQSFWYDRLDYNPPGAMDSSKQKTNNAVAGIDGKDRLSGISSTFNSLDPVASGNTASGAKVMDLFDAPTNYKNGRTEISNLLITDYETNDDLSEYTLTLKEGVQFHGDYGEMTAADVVYSIRRLAESTNSTNQSFAISTLAIEHEVDENGAVKRATGVEAVDDYTVRLTLESPFPYALDVLTYGAFSVVPEGIVGDIEGYEGDMPYPEFSASNPVGTGPFTFVEWDSGNGGSYSADAFEDYHDGAPAIDGIDDAIISDDTARYNYFLNENADSTGIPTSKYDPSLHSSGETLPGGRKLGTYGPMENDKTVNSSSVSTIDTYYVGFNMTKVPKPVRKAMAYVINREQFVSDVFKGRGVGAFHLQPPQLFSDGQEGYNNHYQGE